MATEITAKKGDASATISYEFGDTLEANTELFGEEVVHSSAIRTYIITAQAAIRRYLEAGLSEDEVQQKMSEWKPGVTLSSTVDPVTAVLRKFGTLPVEDQKDLIAKLKAQSA